MEEKEGGTIYKVTCTVYNVYMTTYSTVEVYLKYSTGAEIFAMPAYQIRTVRHIPPLIQDLYGV